MFKVRQITHISETVEGSSYSVAPFFFLGQFTVSSRVFWIFLKFRFFGVATKIYVDSCSNDGDISNGSANTWVRHLKIIMEIQHFCGVIYRKKFFLNTYYTSQKWEFCALSKYGIQSPSSLVKRS